MNHAVNVPESQWKPRARELAAAIAEQTDLSRAWRTAFEETPRHVFVPAYYDDEDHLVDGSDEAMREQWLEAVYSDTSLVTQTIALPAVDLAWPASSSTRPSLMARMLELLDVDTNVRILEIGAGTGYNAALLSHRLGDGNVFSIDIDPALVDAARQRLARLGRNPTPAAGDGAEGMPLTAPYTHIIGTCAVDSIPPAWIAQLADNGVIVADIRGELVSTLVKLRKTSDYEVTGKLLPQPGHFMWLRPTADNPLRYGENCDSVLDMTNPATTTGRIPLAAFFDEPSFRLLLQHAAPDIQPIGATLPDNTQGAFLTTTNGAWAAAGPTQNSADAYPVQHGGPGTLWTSVETAWNTWNRLGQPAVDRFGITATISGEQHLWLDTSDNKIQLSA
ncbi:MAG: methyltransferase domain-containing protein [Stackebrandtia sp.]